MLQLALTIAAITGAVYLAFIMGVLVYYVVKIYRIKHPKTKNISLEEVSKLVEDAMFWELVAKVAEGKMATKDVEVLNDTGYISILQPCEYHNCSCHESREDCCTTGVEIDGKQYCKVLVDINKLCGLPSVKERPDVTKMLTDEECKILANKIVEYMEAK